MTRQYKCHSIYRLNQRAFLQALQHKWNSLMVICLLMMIGRLDLVEGCEELLDFFQHFSIVSRLICFFYQIDDCLDLASILEIVLVARVILADQIQLCALS